MSERGQRWLRGLAHLTLGAGAMLVLIVFVHVGVPIYFRVRGEPSPAMLVSSTASIEDRLGCSPLELTERLTVTYSGGIFRSSAVLYVEGDAGRVESLRERCQFEGVSDHRRPAHSGRWRTITVKELRPDWFGVSIVTTTFGGPA